MDTQKFLEIALIATGTDTTATTIIDYMEVNMELFATVLVMGLGLAVLVFLRIWSKESDKK